MAKAFYILVEVVDRNIVCQAYPTYAEALDNMTHRFNQMSETLTEDEYEGDLDDVHGIAWLNDMKHGYHYDWQIFIREI